jgi:hypothetical protein
MSNAGKTSKLLIWKLDVYIANISLRTVLSPFLWSPLWFIRIYVLTFWYFREVKSLSLVFFEDSKDLNVYVFRNKQFSWRLRRFESSAKLLWQPIIWHADLVICFLLWTIIILCILFHSFDISLDTWILFHRRSLNLKIFPPPNWPEAQIVILCYFSRTRHVCARVLTSLRKITTHWRSIWYGFRSIQLLGFIQGSVF